MIIIIAHEDDAMLAGSCIEPLFEAIGADILVENDNLCLGLLRFQCNGIL